MEKLRILLVSHGVINNTSGVGKVHYDLKKEYQKVGHKVDTLDMTNLYPDGQKAFTKLFGKIYTYRIWKYLQINSHAYDVIDANFECIVYPKASYGYSGLVVARSHGLRPLYEQAEKTDVFHQSLNKRVEKTRLKTWLGNIYRRLQKKTTSEVFFLSLKHSDVIHCLNKDEYNYISNLGVPQAKLVVIPNGIPDATIDQYKQIPSSGQKSDLLYVGSWTARKGINDFHEIFTLIQKEVTINNFFLLGGGYNEAYVRSFFSDKDQQWLNVIPYFKPLDLPNFINNCKVGIFPSYAEGFGLAVIEQLACGIPVVAYEIPGPKEILKPIDSRLLVPVGDFRALAKNVVELMRLSEFDYIILSEKCKKEVLKYRISNIAHQFLEVYDTSVNLIGKQ